MGWLIGIMEGKGRDKCQRGCSGYEVATIIIIIISRARSHTPWARKQYYTAAKKQ
jgi:hypothetical protein